MSNHSADVIVFKSRVITCLTEFLWTMLRDFDSSRLWNSDITNVEHNAGCYKIGCILALYIHDGKVFREWLLEFDDAERTVTYDMVDCPMLIRDSVASNRMTLITAIGRSLAIWQSRFRCRPEDQQEMIHCFDTLVYEEGLEGNEQVMLST